MREAANLEHHCETCAIGRAGSPPAGPVREVGPVERQPIGCHELRSSALRPRHRVLAVLERFHSLDSLGQFLRLYTECRRDLLYRHIAEVVAGSEWEQHVAVAGVSQLEVLVLARENGVAVTLEKAPHLASSNWRKREPFLLAHAETLADPPGGGGHSRRRDCTCCADALPADSARCERRVEDMRNVCQHAACESMCGGVSSGGCQKLPPSRVHSSLVDVTLDTSAQLDEVRRLCLLVSPRLGFAIGNGGFLDTSIWLDLFGVAAHEVTKR